MAFNVYTYITIDEVSYVVWDKNNHDYDLVKDYNNVKELGTFTR